MNPVEENDRHQGHERRFSHIEKNVAILQVDVGTLRTGQVALQDSQTLGFDEIKNIFREKSTEEPKISFKMLLTGIGLLASVIISAVGAFWAVVQLLANPMKEDINEHKSATSHHGTSIALLEERSVNNDVLSKDRHTQQALELNMLRGSIYEIKEREIKDAKERER